MYVCMYAYIYICIYILICIYISLCLCLSLSFSLYHFPFLSLSLFSIYIINRVQFGYTPKQERCGWGIYIFIYMPTYVHVYVYVCIYTRIYAYAHTVYNLATCISEGMWLGQRRNASLKRASALLRFFKSSGSDAASVQHAVARCNGSHCGA